MKLNRQQMEELFTQHQGFNAATVRHRGDTKDRWVDRVQGFQLQCGHGETPWRYDRCLPIAA